MEDMGHIETIIAIGIFMIAAVVLQGFVELIYDLYKHRKDSHNNSTERPE